MKHKDRRHGIPNPYEVKMTLRLILGALAIGLILVTAVNKCQADEWLAQDKAMHFGSGFLAAKVLFTTADESNEPKKNRVLAAVFIMSAAFGKEFYDAHKDNGRGKFSWKDIAAGGAGLAVATFPLPAWVSGGDSHGR